jgi:putative ABC transport system substrate-binding protein
MHFHQWKRREFITLLGSVATAWPLTARAQQPNRIAQIGYLSQESAAFDRGHGDSAAFWDGLRDLGYVEGRNLHIEFRYAEGRPRPAVVRARVRDKQARQSEPVK